jgi:uncharacterized protein YuzE
VGYKIKYDGDADVLTIILKERGKLSHAEEVGDIVVQRARTIFRLYEH